MEFETWLDQVAMQRGRLNREVKELIDAHWQRLLQNSKARDRWQYQPRMVLNRSGAFSVVWEEPHIGPHRDQPLKSTVVAKTYVKRPRAGMTRAQFPKAGEGEWAAIAALEASLDIHVQRRNVLSAISRKIIASERRWRAVSTT